MSNTAEAGRYSLAGFIFQLLGNGVELIEVSGEVDDRDSPRDVLLLERYGQDSAVVDSNGQLKSLNQYKFTSTGQSTSRASLLKILEKLLESAIQAGGTVANCGFTLTTNMEWEPAAQRLLDIRSKEELTHQQKVKAISKSLRFSKQSAELPNAEKLAKLFIKLKHVPTDDTKLIEILEREAAHFGILSHELEERVNELLGLLLRVSGEGGRRTVPASRCLKALTGIPSPYRLLDKKSRRVRTKDIEERRELETSGVATLPRSIVAEIVNAVCQFPIVVVEGKGGVGKSVAIFDAAEAITKDDTNPPGFATVEKAYEITESRLVEKISVWRNRITSEDGPSFDSSLKRLRTAYPKTPRLAVCIDGADERHGFETLPADASNCIRLLALRSLNKHLTDEWDTTLLITCREKNDWEDIFTHTNCVEGETKYTFTINPFTANEMGELASTIPNADIRDLLENRIQMNDRDDVGVLSNNGPSADPTQFELLNRPVLWGIFAVMSSDEQRLFLTGDQGSLHLMSERYLQRFRSKCCHRTPIDLHEHEILGSLVSAAQFSEDPPYMLRKYQDHWILPTTKFGCSRRSALMIFNEACSAGLIRKRSDARDWNWEYPWFLEYLRTRNEV